MLPQLSYAIKNQLKAPKVPYKGHFLPFGVSIRHKVGFYALIESIIGAGVTNIMILPIKDSFLAFPTQQSLFENL